MVLWYDKYDLENEDLKFLDLAHSMYEWGWESFQTSQSWASSDYFAKCMIASAFYAIDIFLQTVY